MHGEVRNSCKILKGKSEMKCKFGRCKFRWEDNIKMFKCGTGCEGMEYIQLSQAKVWLWAGVKMVMKLEIP
jgi:hypothetical protein